MAWTEPCVVIDRTHLGRRASGMERITRDLFSPEILQPLRVQGSRLGAGRLTTMLRQLVLNPLDALRHPKTVWIFSGFPPSPAFGGLAHRSVLYVHDLFLIERTADLNRAGRYYMAPSFRAALRRFRWFLANSATTAERLRPHVDPSASVSLYRPPANDTLGLAALARPRLDAPDGPIKIGMMGTVEPRKNYGAALAIRAALAARMGRSVELHIIGRNGWGSDGSVLGREPNVHMHGFVADGVVAELVKEWDLYLTTSHDEGLGLPLLEVQHAGIPIVASDLPVFREVLGGTGTLIDPAAPMQAAERIDAVLRQPDARGRARDAARLNIARWNQLAADDHAGVLRLLSAMLATLGEA